MPRVEWAPLGWPANLCRAAAGARRPRACPIGRISGKATSKAFSRSCSTMSARSSSAYRGKNSISGKSLPAMTHGPRPSVSAKRPACNLLRKPSPSSAQLDPTTPLVVTFDQPWAEYLASEQLDLAPMHFADALVRADLGLSGLGLEINVGYQPGGSVHRGPLAFSRLVDNWSLLELPLLVALTLPSSAADDPPRPTAMSGYSATKTRLCHTTKRSATGSTNTYRCC